MPPRRRCPPPRLLLARQISPFKMDRRGDAHDITHLSPARRDSNSAAFHRVPISFVAIEWDRSARPVQMELNAPRQDARRHPIRHPGSSHRNQPEIDRPPAAARTHQAKPGPRAGRNDPPAKHSSQLQHRTLARMCPIATPPQKKTRRAAGHPTSPPGSSTYREPSTPIGAPETTISTRRFFSRPASVEFDATGLALPNPAALTVSDGTPCSIR